MYWLRVIIEFTAIAIGMLVAFAAAVIAGLYGLSYLVYFGDRFEENYGRTYSTLLLFGAFVLFFVIMAIIAEISDRIKKRKKKKENKDGLSNV